MALPLSAAFAEFRLLPRSVFVLAGARVVNTFGFSIVTPFLAYHLTTREGGRMTTVGVIYTLAGIIGAAAQLLGGELADRVGRRRVMVASLAVRSITLFALGIAVVRNADIWIIGALIVANSIVRSTFEPAAQSQVAVLAGPAHRTAAFGLQRVGINLGWALGPAIGGLFAGTRYGLLFFFSAGIILLALAACATVPDAPGDRPAPSRISLRDLVDVPRPRAFLLFLAVTVVMSLLTTQLFSTMSVYAMTRLQIPESRFGLLYSVNGILVVALQGLAVRFIHQAGVRTTLFVGPLVYAAGYFAIGLAGSIYSLALAVAVVTLGELITEPSEMVAAVALGDPHRPGRAMGVYGLVSSLGNSAGPGAGAFLYDHTANRPLLLWGTIAALGVAGAAGYRAIGRIETPPPAPGGSDEARV